MTLVIYIVVFSIACFWRRRTLTGAHLKEKLHADGREYLESQMRNDKGKGLSLTLGLLVEGAHSFVIRHEKWYHRFLKSLGLAEEVEIGNSALDDRLYFVTEMPDGFRQFFGMAGVQKNIERLFTDLKIVDLRCFHGKIWVNCGYIPAKLYTPAYAAERLEALGTIANAAEAAAQNTLPAESGLLTKPHMAVFFMIVHTALFMLGILGGLPLLLETMEIVSLKGLLTLGAMIGALLAAFWFYCIFVCLGRSSWVPMALADFTLMGLAGIFLSTVFVVREVNMHFDTAPATEHVRTIIAKQCELTCSSGRGKRRRSTTYDLSESQCKPEARDATLREYEGRDYKCSISARFSYELAVEPWLPEQDKNFLFDVSQSRFDRAKKGDKMTIPSRTGALGLAWVDTDTIKPAE